MGAREQAEAAKLSVKQVKKVQVKYPAVHTHIKNKNYCITVNCLIVRGGILVTAGLCRESLS